MVCTRRGQCTFRPFCPTADTLVIAVSKIPLSFAHVFISSFLDISPLTDILGPGIGAVLCQRPVGLI